MKVGQVYMVEPQDEVEASLVMETCGASIYVPQDHLPPMFGNGYGLWIMPECNYVLLRRAMEKDDESKKSLQ